MENFCCQTKEEKEIAEVVPINIHQQHVAAREVQTKDDLKESLKMELSEEISELQALKFDLLSNVKQELLADVDLRLEIKAKVLNDIMQEIPRIIQGLAKENSFKNEADLNVEALRSTASPVPGEKSANEKSIFEEAEGNVIGRDAEERTITTSQMLVTKSKSDSTGTKRLTVGSLCEKQSKAGVPILDANANELGAQDWIYNWHDTMWDALPFVGLGVMMYSDSALVVIISVLNWLVQAAFIGLVSSNMMESIFYEDGIVGTLQDWRVSYAHNPAFADKFTSTPLAKDVCAESSFMMQGAQQAVLYSETKMYVQTFFGLPAGACLCTLSIFLWVLTCAKEAKSITLFLIGLWTPSDTDTTVAKSHVLIQSRTVLWVYGEATQKNYQLFLTTARKIILILTGVLPRLLILLALGFVGTQFLVATTELDELILNSIALEVVLHVDELLFAIFAPDSAKRVVRKTKPLRVPKLRGVKAQIMPWVRFLSVFVLMFFVAYAMLAPLLDTMHDVEKAMCGGSVDFLAVEVEFGPVISGIPQVSGIDRSNYVYRAIFGRTGLSNDASLAQLTLEGRPFDFTTAQTIENWKSLSMEDWATLDYSDKYFLPCNDNYWVEQYVDSQLSKGFWAGLSAKIGIEGVTSCAEIKHLCYSSGTIIGKSVRLACPTTCGASDALSGLFMDTPLDGLVSSCDAWLANSLSGLQCNDQHLSVLTNLSDPIGQGWKHYAESVIGIVGPTFMVMSAFNMTHYQILAGQLMADMQKYGCNLFSRSGPTGGMVIYRSLRGTPYYVDFCDVDDLRTFGRRTVRSFCPQACGCDTSVKTRYANLGESWNARTGIESECPRSCWAR